MKYIKVNTKDIDEAIIRLRTVISCNDVSDATYDELKFVIDLLAKNKEEKNDD